MALGKEDYIYFDLVVSEQLGKPLSKEKGFQSNEVVNIGDSHEKQII